jgi:hypothetical protein
MSRRPSLQDGKKAPVKSKIKGNNENMKKRSVLNIQIESQSMFGSSWHFSYFSEVPPGEILNIITSSPLLSNSQFQVYNKYSSTFSSSGIYYRAVR